MPIEITVAEAGSNILAHVAEKRLVRANGTGEWHPRQTWLDPVTLLEAIHQDIKGNLDCPVSLMPQWPMACISKLFSGIGKEDIYPIAERYGKLLAADMMAKADDTLRDRWLVFVVKEALASARQIAITNKPSFPWEIPACAEEYSAGAAKAAAEAAAAAEAFPFVDTDRDVGKPWKAARAAEAAAEAAWQAARGWQTAALAISGREQAAAEAAGEEALDAYFETVNHPAHLARMGAIFVTADLALARGDGRYARIMRSLGGTQLLILDDWGLDPLDAGPGPGRQMARGDWRPDLCRRHPRSPRPQRPPHRSRRRQPATDPTETGHKGLTHSSLLAKNQPASRTPQAGDIMSEQRAT